MFSDREQVDKASLKRFFALLRMTAKEKKGITFGNMPENKKPLIRYQTIDRCIRNTAQQYSFEELLEEVNDDLVYRGLDPIGKTTFYQDIKDMQLEFQAPIETYWEGRKKYYRYADPGYSFGNQPLNQGEIEHIKDAVLILGRFSGIPGFEWIDEVISKLEIGTYEEVSDPNVISFESNEFLKGKEFIGPIFKAIIARQVLDIQYQTFESEETKTHRIHPYHLKEFDSRWYVFGYYPKRDFLMTLSIDRIQSIAFPDEPYIDNTRFNFSEYFEDFIGIRRETELDEQHIILKFSPLMANYVRTKPLHGSQKNVEQLEDGSLVVSIDVIPNFELENLIFSFKDGVEVLEPESFRRQIATIASKLYNSYA